MLFILCLLTYSLYQVHSSFFIVRVVYMEDYKQRIQAARALIQEQLNIDGNFLSELQQMLITYNEYWHNQLSLAETELHRLRQENASLEQTQTFPQLQEVAQRVDELYVKAGGQVNTKPDLQSIDDTIFQLKDTLKQKIRETELEMATLTSELALEPLAAQIEREFEEKDGEFRDSTEGLDLIQLYKNMGVRVKPEGSSDQVVIHDLAAKTLKVISVPVGKDDFVVTNSIWDQIVGSD